MASKKYEMSTDDIPKKDGDIKKKQCGLSPRELAFLAIATIFLCVIISLAVLLGLEMNTRPKERITTPDIADTCLTEQCARTTARISDALDYSVKPCDDFYQFACGTWNKKHVIPEDRSSFNTFGALYDEVQVTLKYLLEADVQATDNEAVVKAKHLYQNCFNESLIEDRGIDVIFPLLRELKEWPVLGNVTGRNWDNESFNLVDLLVTMRKYNNAPIIYMGVSTDIKSSQDRIIYLDQPGFGMPSREYLLKGMDDPNVKAYLKLATDIAVGLGAEMNSSSTELTAMVEFEIQLANISVRSEDRRDSNLLYNKMEARNLTHNFTETYNFNWMDYLRKIMNLPEVEVPLPDTEPVVVWSPPYFSKLFEVLEKTPTRTVANYVVWRMVRNRASSLPKRFRDMFTEYYKVLYGTETASARWQSCVGYAGGTFGLAVGRLFVEEAFDEEAKTDMLLMISNLRTAFKELLNDLDWMDAETRAVAREKADAIQEKIGYSDDILRDDFINTYYENITINRGQYFENILENIQESAAYGLRLLRQKVDKNLWTTPPATVNAFYSSTYNRIMFPAGILQPPFYQKGQPKSMNYGAIGVVIGHEITHGFDDRGRQYDKDGNLAQWWSDDAIAKFTQKAQCIINQYSQYLVPEAGMNINGINTQGENIADNGGLKQSYKAYRQWVQTQGKEEPALPGLNLTHNQLFFIGFAQVWCGNMRPGSAVSRILTGVHSPGQFRVIGTLQNSKDFSDAFNCPVGSYMRPPKENRCQVW